MCEAYTIKLVHRHKGKGRNDTVLDTFAPDGEGGWEPVRKSRHEVPLEGTSPFPERQDWTPKEPEMRPFSADEMRESRKEARRFARENPEFPEYSDTPVWLGDTRVPIRLLLRAATRIMGRDLGSRIAWQINRRCPGCGEVLSYSFREETLYREFDGVRAEGRRKVDVDALARALDS
ncbi:hypothetical protein [Schaalia odontolytica]|uniref:hypothetical protein n=1 Tax=Schaalia odontolytica TaxID=1660 RepID=UPI001D05F52B|nr:hypothetical protein [Schaalia odontolytica]MCB6401429.1 hypothetical protein [Schaalia odontolytica]